MGESTGGGGCVGMAGLDQIFNNEAVAAETTHKLFPAMDEFERACFAML